MEGLLWCAQVIVESGAKACEVMVSGQFCRQRTKSVKVVDGLRIHSGGPFNYDIDTAVYHMMLRQVMLGIKLQVEALERNRTYAVERGKAIYRLVKWRPADFLSTPLLTLRMEENTQEGVLDEV
ncbi:hypothetical protein CB1_000727002 [Camelus ferus]|nr:hypothetical protein CB1_000727002 [Camelus ferus]